MRALYEIDQEIMNFELEIDEETGEVLNALDLDNLKMEREQKIEGIGLWYKNLKAEKEMVKAEKNAFAEREKKLDKKIEGIKGYLEYALKGEKFSTSKVAMSFRSSKSVEIDIDAKIPEAFLRIKTSHEPDKKLLKEAIENGEQIDGVKLIEKKNINIK